MIPEVLGIVGDRKGNNMPRDKKGYLDKLREKVISRKFLVFILATTFLPLGFITSEGWVILAGIYIGTQAAVDILIARASNLTPTLPDNLPQD